MEKRVIVLIPYQKLAECLNLAPGVEVADILPQSFDLKAQRALPILLKGDGLPPEMDMGEDEKTLVCNLPEVTAPKLHEAEDPSGN